MQLLIAPPMQLISGRMAEGAMTLRFLRVDLRCDGRHEQIQVRLHDVDVLGTRQCVRYS